MEVQTITRFGHRKNDRGQTHGIRVDQAGPGEAGQGHFLEKRRSTLSENALTVLKRRYLKKDSQGKLIETPEKMFRRVAQHIAKAEKNYGADDARVKDVEDVFYSLMTQVRLSAQFPHADERRPAPGPAGGLLRAAGGRHAWRASSAPCATPP